MLFSLSQIQGLRITEQKMHLTFYSFLYSLNLQLQSSHYVEGPVPLDVEDKEVNDVWPLPLGSLPSS